MREGRRRRFAKGEVVFHEGDPGDTLHLIVKGHVAVRRSTPLGEVATFVILGPGEVFGELVLLSPDSGRSATVCALDALDTLVLRRDQLESLRTNHPSVDQLLFDLMARDIRRLSTLLSDALYVPVEKRVLRRLLEVAEVYGRGESDATIPLTQEDLAGLAGTTRPTTNRVLRSAEAAGLIGVSRGKIRINDVSGLTLRAT